MIDIGLNGPEDQAALRRVLGMIDLIRQLHDGLPPDPVQLGEPGSDIERLVRRPPEPPVDLRLSLQAGLLAARGSLDQILMFLVDDVPTTPPVMQALLRSALLGAGRVVYVLGPDDAREREMNASTVLRQEAKSLMRAYDTFERFERFQALQPPAEVLAAQRARNKNLQAGGSPPGEEKTLQAMAHVIGQMMAVYSDKVDESESALTESVAWVFHVCSGVAHGFGWPTLLPSWGSMPGHFLVDLHFVTSVAHLAFDITAKRAKGSPSNESDA